jgi:hypothetical protein
MNKTIKKDDVRFKDLKVKGYAVLSIKDLKRMLDETKKQAKLLHKEKKIKSIHTKVFYATLTYVKNKKDNLIQISFNR